MTSDPAVWHQALAHGSAAEEEEAQRTLEAQNNTLRSQHDQILASLESLKRRFAS